MGTFVSFVLKFNVLDNNFFSHVGIDPLLPRYLPVLQGVNVSYS